MKQYIKKSAVVAEIEKKKIPFLKDIDDGVYPTYLCALMDFEDFIDTLEVKEVKEEPVNEDLKEAAEEYAPDFSNSIASKAAVDAVRDAFKAGAEWMQSNLWKSTDGENLPEIDREVVVFTQKEGLSPRVGIAHRPDPNGWDGTSISTGKTEHFEPMLYGKGGWSLPDVKWWLDCKLPFKENEI